MWPGTQTTNYWPAGQQQKPSKPESHATESLKIAYLGGPANSWHFWLYLKTSHYDGQISQISWRFYGLERGVRYICIYVCVWANYNHQREIVRTWTKRKSNTNSWSLIRRHKNLICDKSDNNPGPILTPYSSWPKNAYIYVRIYSACQPHVVCAIKITV